MRYILCIIFISIAVVINIPVLALMLGIIFVSIKSHRNLIAPSLGTKLLQAGIIIIGFTTTSSTAINLISEFFLTLPLYNFSANNKYPLNGSSTCCHGLVDMGFRNSILRFLEKYLKII